MYIYIYIHTLCNLYPAGPPAAAPCTAGTGGTPSRTLRRSSRAYICLLLLTIIAVVTSLSLSLYIYIHICLHV